MKGVCAGGDGGGGDGDGDLADKDMTSVTCWVLHCIVAINHILGHVCE